MSKDATYKARNRRKPAPSQGSVPGDATTAGDPGSAASPTSITGGPNLRPDPSAPDGHPVPLLDLRPGDRVHLPLAGEGAEPLRWSEPVTISSVLLVDSGLAEVRWEPGAGGDPWAAHLLLMGPAYTAGALRAG
jgi:hypothetical protein